MQRGDKKKKIEELECNEDALARVLTQIGEFKGIVAMSKERSDPEETTLRVRLLLGHCKRYSISPLPPLPNAAGK